MTKTYNRRPTKAEKEKYLLLSLFYYSQGPLYSLQKGVTPDVEFAFESNGELEVLLGFEVEDKAAELLIVAEALRNETELLNKLSNSREVANYESI